MNAVNPVDPLLEAALSYARRGWQVFPLRRGTKGSDTQGRSTHLLPNGHLDASCDPQLIRRWWSRWPGANIGLSLAASGLVALDVDLYKPECGWHAFIRGRDVPPTLIQSSARGGRHFIFRASPEARFAGKLCAGVDIKHRGYILLEPSTFETGVYQFENDDDPAQVPVWVAAGEQESEADLGTSSESLFHFDAGTFTTTSAAEVEELLSWLDPDAVGYDAWIEVLQALHDHFGGNDEGLTIAETWSRRGAMFREGEVAAKWRGFRLGGGVTLKSVAKRARQKGADLSDIARRHGKGASARTTTGNEDPETDPFDLSHDRLALDLGARSWDADARHVALWGKWLFWSGAHWRRDETLEHLSRVRAWLRTRAAEFSEWSEHRAVALEAERKTTTAATVRRQAREQARQLRSSATVAAVAGLARANPKSVATHTAFDTDPYLLGTPGGTVDLRTGLLREARREDMISRLTACAPADPGTRPDLWLRYLHEVLEGDADTIAFLQRAAGYALTGSTNEHKLLFLYGSGRNGKSRFIDTLLHLWGDYGRRVAATTFISSQTERHPTDVAGLQGARLAIASELPRGKTWDDAVIKDLTGGDRLTARLMRQDYFDFDPQMTIMISGNTQPSFRGVDEAIRSRVVLVPFRVTIPPEKRDRNLQTRLIAEGPTILRWCIDGTVAWMERGLDVPPSIAGASKAYFDEEDTVGQFLEDETVKEPQSLATYADLILRFNFWCDRQCLGHWTQRTLVKELRQRGFDEGRTSQQRGLRGLRLR